MKTKIYKGSVEITEDNQAEWELTLKDVTEITGYCYIHAQASLKADALTTIGGHCNIYAQASLKADALTTIGGDCNIYAQASLPALTTIGGHCNIYAQASLPALTTIGGDCYIHAQASLPALTTIGGDCYIHAQASLPALTTIGGDCNIYAQASLKADALTTIGGHCNIYAQASLKADNLIKGKKVDAKSIVRKAFYKQGYLFADGILSRIVSKRKAGKVIIWKTTKIGNRDKVIYVVQRGETFSHGETVKQAVHDLRYKLDGNRDTSEYKKWTLATVKPVAELIRAYRVITGSCETGTKAWCDGKKLPARVSVKIAIRLTRGAYQAGKFAEFFKR